MRKYDFETIIDRKGTESFKIDPDLIKEKFGVNCYEDTISMWVADMDFAVMPEILDGISARLDRKILGYTKKSDQYYNSIIDKYKRTHDMDIQKDWLAYSSGTVAAIRNVIKAFTKEGEKAIVQTPIYFPFMKQIMETRREVVQNELLRDENNNYSIDFDDFEKKCQDPDTKLFLFCNPHNPVGKIWTAEEVQKLLNICHENNVIFFADEIHSDILRKGNKFVSALNLDHSENTVIATAVNKTFNTAGLHITNLVIKDRALREQFNDYTGEVRISPLAMEATIIAYNEGDEWVRQMNEVVDANIEYVDQFIKVNMPKVKFNKPEGTYLVWLDFRDYGIDEKELMRKLADEARVIFEPGSVFGASGTGFIRINVASPKALLAEALNRTAKIFK